MSGFTKQNCNVACLQNRKNPIVYVLPMSNIKVIINLEKVELTQNKQTSQTTCAIET